MLIVPSWFKWSSEISFQGITTPFLLFTKDADWIDGNKSRKVPERQKFQLNILYIVYFNNAVNSSNILSRFSTTSTGLTPMQFNQPFRSLTTSFFSNADGKMPMDFTWTNHLLLHQTWTNCQGCLQKASAQEKSADASGTFSAVLTSDFEEKSTFVTNQLMKFEQVSLS